MVKLTVRSLLETRKDISASSEILGQVSGSLLGGYSGGRWGPRRTILASCLAGGLGWLTISLSPALWVIIVGRVLCGVSTSATTANCSLLVAQYR